MNSDTENEPPTEFLTRIGGELSGQKGVDHELVAILRTHLLTAEAVADCVANAKTAVVNLATQRAKTAIEEQENG